MEENTNQPISNVNTSDIPSVSQNPSSVPSPINPPAGGPKSKLPIIIIGIIVFFLIAGSAAGFYVFKQQSSNIAEKPTPSPIVQKQIPSPTSDPTGSWKTFQGDGFTIKYPEEVKLVRPNRFSSTLPPSRLPNSDPNAIFDYIPNDELLIEPIQITSIADVLKKYCAPTDLNCNQSYKVIMVNNATGIQLPESNYMQITLLQKDKNSEFFAIIITARPPLTSTSSIVQTYKNMISTFKFTSQESLISPTIDQRMACKTDADCATDEVCATAGPVIQGAAQQMSCWKKNEPRPL